MNNRIRKLSLIINAIACLTLFGCNSLKDGSVGRLYHNITAHYNIYFNGYEEFKKITQSIENDHTDHYNSILDIYQFADEKAARSIYSSADIVLRKCTKLIDKHKVSKWVDDSYFLIGKAHFYKRDYFAAIETFQFIAANYKDSKLAYESMIWTVLCNIQLEKYDEAHAIITLIKSDKNLPSSLEKELLLTEAFLKTLTKDYLSAIQNLEQAIPKERKKYYKTRYSFILAQLYQETENYNKASDLYKLVIKKNPPYEMAFNSKIGLSKCIKIESERDARVVKNHLNKMLKDDKNIQYFDQIYYELALVELKLGHLKEAEKYFKLCLDISKGNKNIKALAYLALAEFYFNNSNYIPSKAYFDSSAMNMTPDFPGYKEINKKNRVLRELLSYLVTIETEDSLQYLASVDKSERDSIINVAYNEEKRLQKEREKQERAKKAEEAQQQKFDNQLLRNRNMMPGGNIPNRSSWYFANPSAVEIGRAEFNVRWGKRPLEDDWRRKKKASVFQDMEYDEDGFKEKEKDSVVLSEDDLKTIENIVGGIPKDKQKYYTDIPFTESLLEASDKSIMEALWGAGHIYSEKLDDDLKAIETYEELIKRFPEFEYNLQTHYLLYKLYDKTGNEEKKEQHRKFIIENHPDSDYALLLKNPEGFKDRMDKKNSELETLYQATYKFYLDNNCDGVLENVENSENLFDRNIYKAKFQYLKTICLGRNGTTEEFIKLLKEFIKKYKKEDITSHANNVLAYLTKLETERLAMIADTLGEEDTTGIDSLVAVSPFNSNQEGTHYFIFAFPPRNYNANDLKASFSNYNSEYHQLKKLEILSFIFDPSRKFLVVKQFKNGEKAIRYLKDLLFDEIIMAKVRTKSPEFLVISLENFTTLMKEKDLGQYQDFYQKHYPN